MKTEKIEKRGFDLKSTVMMNAAAASGSNGG